MTTADTPFPARPKRVACPTCGGDSIYASSNPFRPFCSERCKNVDLGAWASESFRVPVKHLAEDQLTDAVDLVRSSVNH
jgi:endogenous inhibitor of DNA gyrase (YacG/DUF329 family)